jgi:hypothetical protein
MKELKVNIPTELHLQLLRVKFLKGQTIASTVEQALRAYFADGEGLEARAAPSARDVAHR